MFSMLFVFCIKEVYIQKTSLDTKYYIYIYIYITVTVIL